MPEDSVGSVAKFIAEFDGTARSAEQILAKTQYFRQKVQKQLEALQTELEAIDSLARYIHRLRNEALEGLRAPTTTPPVRPPGTRARADDPWQQFIRHGTEHALQTRDERVQATIEAAKSLIRDGFREFEAAQVAEVLSHRGINLGVEQPIPVIGTILAGDARFRKVSPRKFAYTGE